MHILEILSNKRKSRKPVNYDYDIRVRIRPHESHNTWEDRLAIYWDMLPKWTKEIMNNDDYSNTLIITNCLTKGNPMYYLFGTTKFASLDYYQYYRSSKWKIYSPPTKTSPYRQDLDYGKNVEELFKNVLVEETTSNLIRLNINKLLLDIEFFKKPKDLKEILTRYKNVGWKLVGITELPEKTNKLFIVLDYQIKTL